MPKGLAPDAVGSVGGHKRSTVLIAAMVAEWIVNNIRIVKRTTWMKKGAGRRKSAPPLNLLRMSFLLVRRSNGIGSLSAY